MSMHRRTIWPLSRLAVVGMAALGLAVSACGSSSPKTAASSTAAPGAGSSASSGATPTSGSGSSAIVTQAKAALVAGYAGTDRPLPTLAPTPKKGEKVVIVTCGLVAEGCATAASAEQEAGNLIGWHMSIFDGKLDPSQYVVGVRQAIAEGAQGIILNTVDCGTVKSAVQQARAQGIAVLGVESLDCNDPSQGSGQSLFSGTMGYGKYTIQTYNQDVLGPAIANYMIATTDGHAKVIEMHEDDVAGLVSLDKGFEARMAQCTTCVVYRTAFSGADLANGGLKSKAAAALVAHPDANAVYSPYDAAVLAGIGPAVKASGQKVIITGNEGITASITSMRAGGYPTMVPGTPLRWNGFAAIDEINRLLHHQPLVDEGIGYQIVDRAHMIPTRYKFYDGNTRTDYQAAYKKIWGA